MENEKVFQYSNKEYAYEYTYYKIRLYCMSNIYLIIFLIY